MRDKQKREIDFVVVKNKKPWLAVEARLSDTTPSHHFRAFEKQLEGVPLVQVTAASTKTKRFGKNTLVVNAADFFVHTP